jgi:hypothetical protein
MSISFATSVIYWVMHMKDPNSIPKHSDDIPLVLNLFLNGGVYFVNLSEQIIFNPRKTNNIVSKKFVVAFMIAYTLILMGTFIWTKYPINPFVEEPILEFCVTILNATIFSLVGNQIYVLLSRPGHFKSNKNETEKKTS